MLAPWKKSYEKPRQHIKRRDITNKGLYSQSYGFPVVMHGCESWTKHWRIDAFELWCWRSLLRVPWTARRSNQSILKEINPEYSLGLMLKLKLQCFGHLMGRVNLLQKTLMLEKIEGRRRGWQLDGWMASLTQRTWVWASFRRWWRRGKPGVLQSMGLQRVRHNWVTEQQDRISLRITFLLRDLDTSVINIALSWRTRNWTQYYSGLYLV